MNTLSVDALARALSIRDLSDPAQGPHAMQDIVAAVEAAVAERYACPVHRLRGPRLVPVGDNHDALGYPATRVARDARYSCQAGAGRMLRTRTTAAVPGWLRGFSDRTPRRLALATPGLVHRRDRIDRLHAGEPHQLDLWILLPRGDAGDRWDMADRAAAAVLATALPGHAVEATAAERPYTIDGARLDALSRNARRVAVGECGRIAPELLARTGWDPERVTGIGMRLGLDRLLMLRKGIPDIRLLRSRDPRVLAQMQDLEPWRRISEQPAARRELSLAVEAGLDAETLGDRIRAALPDALELLEAVQIVARAHREAPPPATAGQSARRPGTEEVRVRLALRHPCRGVTRREADATCSHLHRALHRGDALERAG